MVYCGIFQNTFSLNIGNNGFCRVVRSPIVSHPFYCSVRVSPYRSCQSLCDLPCDTDNSTWVPCDTCPFQQIKYPRYGIKLYRGYFCTKHHFYSGTDFYCILLVFSIIHYQSSFSFQVGSAGRILFYADLCFVHSEPYPFPLHNLKYTLNKRYFQGHIRTACHPRYCP